MRISDWSSDVCSSDLALVAQGANQINGPSLSVDQADAALDEARTAALAKARQRAELYDKAAGLRVKRIISISEGGAVSLPLPSQVARMSMAKAEMDDTPMMPGKTEMSVTVKVSIEKELAGWGLPRAIVA